MKSRKRIITISIIFIILGSVCIGLGLASGGSLRALRISMGFDKNGFYFSDHLATPDTQELVLHDITSLSVDINMGSITIVEGTKDEIQILNVLEDQYTLDVKDSKAKLSLETKGGFSIFNFGNDFKQEIEIIVPKGFIFENLDIENSMGDIVLMDIETEHLEVYAGMGDIEADNLKTETLYVNNSMGNIELSGIFLNDSTIKNSMGDIEVDVYDEIQKYDYEANCKMGDVHINGKKGNTYQSLQNDNKIEIENSMGDISLDFK